MEMAQSGKERILNLITTNQCPRRLVTFTFHMQYVYSFGRAPLYLQYP